MGPNGLQGRQVQAELCLARCQFFFGAKSALPEASWGDPGASWGRFGPLPPLPGGLREVILGGFLRPLERGLEKTFVRSIFIVFCVCLSFNVWLFFGLRCLPSCASGGDANIEKT